MANPWEEDLSAQPEDTGPKPWEQDISGGSTDAQELGNKYSGVVNSISQQKKEAPAPHIQGSSIRGGAVEGALTNITSNARIMAAAKTGDLTGTGFDEANVEGLPKNPMQLSEEEMKAFNEAKDPGISSLVTGDKSSAYEKRAQILSQVRQRAIDEAYGDSSRDNWQAKTAKFISGVVTDPISIAFPAGRGLKAAAAFGGLIGATQSASDDLSEGKAIDPTDLAISTILTASGGVVLQGSAHLLGRAVKEVLGTFMNKGSKVTADALQQEMKARGIKGADIGQLDFNSMASKLNSEFRLNGVTPEQVHSKAKLDVQAGYTLDNGTNDLNIIDHNFFDAKAAEFQPVEYSLPKGPQTKRVTKVTPGSPATKATIDKEWNFVPAKDAVPETSATYDVTIPTYEGGYGNLGVGKKGENKPGKAGYKPAIEAPNYFSGDLTLGNKVDYTNLVDNANNYVMARNKKPNVEIEAAGTTQKTRLEAKKNKSGKVDYVPTTTTIEPNSEALDKIYADTLAAKQERFNLLTDAVPVGSPTYNKVATEALQAQGGLSPKAYTAVGDTHGMIRGAIENKEIPWTGEIADTFAPSLGEKPMDLNNPDPKTVKKWILRYHEFASEYVEAPWRAWAASGNNGKAAAKMFNDANVNLHSRLGRHMTNYDIMLDKLKIEGGSPHEQMAADVLRGILKPSDVPDNVLQFAGFMHKTFAAHLTESVKVGILSQAHADALLKKGVTKGYFPRIWNNDFLDTNAGKALWEEKIGGHGFLSEKDARNAYEAITHTDTKVSAPISITKSGDKYFIPMDAVRKSWNDRGVAHASMRSAHLEAKRVFPEELEKLLKPFLQQDVKAVFGKYIKDVGTQIEFSKIFGGLDSKGKWNRDANALKLYEGMTKEGTPHIADNFLESYWQGVGDYAQSKNLKSFLDRADWTRNFYGRLGAFETLKMTFSAVGNLGQIVNHFTTVASNAGLTSRDVLSVYKKGLVDVFKTVASKEARRDLDKGGATIDHVMVDTFSGLNGARNTIAGRELSKFNPLEYLSNPEKFLKANQFMGTEAWNRRVGHTFGVAYTERLLERKIEILKTPSRIDKVKLENINKGLEEMGISRNLDPSKISKAIIDRAGGVANDHLDNMISQAGQRFSNKVNFINAPNTMPQFSGSFFGRIMYRYKSYVLHQTQLDIDNIFKPLVSKNNATRVAGMKALAVRVGAGTAVGIPIDAFYRWILSDDTEYTQTQLWVRALGRVGGFTMMYDIGKAAGTNVYGAMAWAAGPSFSDMSKTLYGVKKSYDTWSEKDGLDVTSKDVKPLVKQVTDMTPFTRTMAKKFLNDKDQFDASFDTKETKFDESFK